MHTKPLFLLLLDPCIQRYILCEQIWQCYESCSIWGLDVLKGCPFMWPMLSAFIFLLHLLQTWWPRSIIGCLIFVPKFPFSRSHPRFSDYCMCDRRWAGGGGVVLSHGKYNQKFNIFVTFWHKRCMKFPDWS